MVIAFHIFQFRIAERLTSHEDHSNNANSLVRQDICFCYIIKSGMSRTLLVSVKGKGLLAASLSH